MRTNIDISDELIDEGRKLTGISTKKELVEEGLRLLIRLKKQQDIRGFRGKLKWTGDLRSARGTR